jgi:hypothetical protein
VTDATRDRTTGFSQEIALTLQELKTASTDAEVQKLNGKLAVPNGQLAQRRLRPLDAAKWTR